jgi:hypothetical protein
MHVILQFSIQPYSFVECYIGMLDLKWTHLSAPSSLENSTGPALRRLDRCFFIIYNIHVLLDKLVAVVCLLVHSFLSCVAVPACRIQSVDTTACVQFWGNTYIPIWHVFIGDQCLPKSYRDFVRICGWTLWHCYVATQVSIITSSVPLQ